MRELVIRGRSRNARKVAIGHGAGGVLIRDGVLPYNMPQSAERDSACDADYLLRRS
jgi:hypothetical protein